MDNLKLKQKTISGINWKILENFGAQFISFFITVILARILLPSDYGLVALVSVFIVIGNVFVQTGFSSAIIQKEEIDEIEYSSVFYAGIFISLILYLFFFFIAPLVASFYGEPILKWLLRVQSLSIVFSAFSSVHKAILTRELKFKRIFKYRVFVTLLSGIIGIGFALYGLGVWALVASSVTSSLALTLSYFIVIKWMPIWSYSHDKIKNLFRFSSRILLLNLMNTIYNSALSLVIGKTSNSSILGFYNRGIQLPHLIMVNTDGAINEVMFPVFSKFQRDKIMLVNALRRALKSSTYIVFPMMIGLASVAKPITIVLLTDKWLPSVPFMIVASLTCMTWPFSIKSHALNALGRSDISLKLNLIGKVIGVIVILSLVRYGAFILVCGLFFSSVLNVLIGFYVVKSVLPYSITKQLSDILPSLILSILMGSLIYPISFIDASPFFILVLQVILGIITYLVLSILTKNDNFMYFFNLLSRLRINSN